MVSIKYGKKQKFTMDGYLDSNLNIIITKAIPNHWDNVGIMFGREGVGKTSLAVQICVRLDRKFSVKNIVFSPGQFSEAIDNATPGTAILWDEAITGANISNHANSTSIAIISKLTMIRKKQLHIILCFPYLYMMNKYFISRCLWSIYVYAKGFDDRGYARYFNSERTERVYNLMKEKFRYDYMAALRVIKSNFHFKFPKNFCVDKDIYEDKKDSASKLDEKNSKEELDIRDFQIMQRIKDHSDLSIERLQLIFGKSNNWFYRQRNKHTTLT